MRRFGPRCLCSLSGLLWSPFESAGPGQWVLGSLRLRGLALSVWVSLHPTLTPPPGLPGGVAWGPGGVLGAPPLRDTVLYLKPGARRE